jgi:hypothetical protein
MAWGGPGGGPGGGGPGGPIGGPPPGGGPMGGWGGPRRPGMGEGCCLGPAACCGPMLLLALPATLGMAALHPVRTVRRVRAQAERIRREEREAGAAH